MNWSLVPDEAVASHVYGGLDSRTCQTGHRVDARCQSAGCLLARCTPPARPGWLFRKSQYPDIVQKELGETERELQSKGEPILVYAGAKQRFAVELSCTRSYLISRRSASSVGDRGDGITRPSRCILGEA